MEQISISNASNVTLQSRRLKKTKTDWDFSKQYVFQVYTGVKFISLNEPEDDMGWHAKLQANNNEINHAAEDPNILVKNEIYIFNGLSSICDLSFLPIVNLFWFSSLRITRLDISLSTQFLERVGRPWILKDSKGLISTFIRHGKNINFSTNNFLPWKINTQESLKLAQHA